MQNGGVACSVDSIGDDSSADKVSQKGDSGQTPQAFTVVFSYSALKQTKKASFCGVGVGVGVTLSLL